jgi:hypothetical protein
MAVTMKKAVFWDVATCRYCVNATDCTCSRWFARGIILVFTLKMGAIRSFETSVNNIYTAPHPRRLLSSNLNLYVIHDFP